MVATGGSTVARFRVSDAIFREGNTAKTAVNVTSSMPNKSVSVIDVLS